MRILTGRSVCLKPKLKAGLDDEEVLVGHGGQLLGELSELYSLALARAIGIVGQYTRLAVVDQVIVLVLGLVANGEEGLVELLRVRQCGRI